MHPTLRRLKQIFGSYAFIEGWAHYTEKMVIDEGYGQSKSDTPTDEVKRPRNSAWHNPTKRCCGFAGWWFPSGCTRRE